MSIKTKKTRNHVMGVVRIFCLMFLAVLLHVGTTLAQEVAEVDLGGVSPRDRQTIKVFTARVKEYTNMREAIEAAMPKLPKEASAEQIQAHQAALKEKVRASRMLAKRGQVFTPGIARYIRATIRDEFKGAKRAELVESVFEADTKGVPLRVNHTYPANKELVAMPPLLLMRLPQIPKQVRYRFVGRNLMLVDRENHLIVDYMPAALP